jgi:rhodanese-related sulfurtransferase
MNTPILSPAEAYNRISDGEVAVLIDVRTPVEFEEVHAPQAVNVPLDRLSPDSLASAGCTPGDQPVYLLCRSGQRATKAAAKLIEAGFTHPIVVTGGTLAWIDAGLPVTRGATKMISLERQARIAAGTLVFTGSILAWFVHPAFVWLPGFVGAGLMFAGVMDFCGMGLLLAKMPWNRKN